MQTTRDPGISEWGNPAGVMPGHSLAEYIGPGERTRRTETSQYPEEEKTTVTPQVAVSERGIAQTGGRVQHDRWLRCRGCGIRTEGACRPLAELQSWILAELYWKGRP